MSFFLAKNIRSRAALAGIVALALPTSYYYPRWRNVAEGPAKRTVDIIYSFTISDIPQQAQHIRVWVPLPPTNNQQKLHALDVPAERPFKIVKEPEYGNRFLSFSLTNTDLSAAAEVAVCMKFRVTRYAIQPLQQSASDQRIAQDKLANSLSADRLIPIDGKIAAEAHQVAGYLQNPLKQARLLYDHIVATVTYDKSGTGWGRGDAVYACDVRTGNCTDFHSLFIGQARALGIPARFIMGLPLPENKTEGFIPGYHCWGEFYLPEKGWCPIDASEASKFPEKKEQFFGGLDEHRVAFTLGRDIKLPGSTAEPLNYAIYPHVEIDGRPHENIQTSFFFKGYTTTGKQTESSTMKTLLSQQI